MGAVCTYPEAACQHTVRILTSTTTTLGHAARVAHDLPFTGASIAPLVELGIFILAIGILLLALTRRAL